MKVKNAILIIKHCGRKVFKNINDADVDLFDDTVSVKEVGSNVTQFYDKKSVYIRCTSESLINNEVSNQTKVYLI